MIRSIGLVVMTLPFHGGNENSIFSWTTKFFLLTGATVSSRLCVFFLWGYRPAEESTDLKSVKRWFESICTYHFCSFINFSNTIHPATKKRTHDNGLGNLLRMVSEEKLRFGSNYPSRNTILQQ